MFGYLVFGQDLEATPATGRATTPNVGDFRVEGLVCVLGFRVEGLAYQLKVPECVCIYI